MVKSGPKRAGAGSKKAANAAPSVKKKKQGVDKAVAKRGQAKVASVAKRKAGASPSAKLSKKTKLDIDAPATQSMAQRRRGFLGANKV